MLQCGRKRAGPLATAALVLVMPAGTLAAVPAWVAAGLYPDDGAMSAAVEAKLAADEQTRSMPIRVHSYDGVVQLEGVVDSEARAERATELAHEVSGVWRVQNVLAVRLAAEPAPGRCTRETLDADSRAATSD
jgi:hypothetical protein